MDNVERNALLGDKNAQEGLSWHGVLLKCPCCEDTPDYWQSGNGGFVECTGCGLQMKDSTLEGAIELWNTRPVPPIGRCGECKYQGGNIPGNPNVLCINMKPDDFCSYFKPKRQ